MIQAIKSKIALGLIAATAAVLLAVTLFAAPSYAQDTNNYTQCGSKIILKEQKCDVGDEASTDIEDLIKTIINIFSAVVGAVSVIMIIVGGFRYITSGGDSNNVGAAKNTILYAIVGLVIVAVAQIIVQFVLERTTS